MKYEGDFFRVDFQEKEDELILHTRFKVSFTLSGIIRDINGVDYANTNGAHSIKIQIGKLFTQQEVADAICEKILDLNKKEQL